VADESPIGVAFVGAGIVSEMHGRAVAALPQARLVGVYDPKQARARALTKKFGGRVFRSLEELLSHKQVKAVHILTPVEHHVSAAIRSMEAGKHVLVEKPVAHDLTDLRKLLRTARKTQRVCMPGHNYIYAPPMQRAKRLIEDGKLGRIGSLWVLFNIFHPEQVAAIYGGVLRAICIHHAYSLLYLLGKPKRLKATVSRVHYSKLTCEDQAMITCEMPGGALANLWCSFASNDPTSDPWTVLYKILGTKGGLTYSWNEAQFEDPRGPGWGLPCYVESFAGEIDHFVNRCIRLGAPPLSSLEDAMDALRIIEAAERSARRQGTEVSLIS
jgi:predicted dehydrogenase